MGMLRGRPSTPGDQAPAASTSLDAIIVLPEASSTHGRSFSRSIDVTRTWITVTLEVASTISRRTRKSATLSTAPSPGYRMAPRAVPIAGSSECSSADVSHCPPNDARAVRLWFVEHQLEDAFAVQRNEGACNFSQRFDVTRIQVARGERECMCGTFGALDARRQHAGGGARRFAGVVIGDDGNVGATGCECSARGEANQPAADDDYVAPPQQGGVAFSW